MGVACSTSDDASEDGKNGVIREKGGRAPLSVDGVNVNGETKTEIPDGSKLWAQK